jgi:membrane associated rhomboid family serine protease
MGIYDREYIRGESSGTGLFSGVTPVTKSIIVISVVVFVLQNLLRWDSNWDPMGFTRQWLAASPETTFHHFRIWQLLTAAFVHANPWQVVFDMYFLWIIGREMESLYGSRDFLVFYIASAVLTTLAGVTVAASAPGLADAPILGSWGPILAVMTLYTLFYPRKEILFSFFIPMPMWVLLLIYIVIPFLGRFSFGSPGIDLGMVLAGAGFAAAFKHFDLRYSKLTWGRSFRPRLRSFSSVSSDQGRPRGSGPSRSSSSLGGGGRSPGVSVLPEEQLDARLDEVLAKIAREGNRDGLTEEEQRVLQEASRRARIRRSDRI